MPQSRDTPKSPHLCLFARQQPYVVAQPPAIRRRACDTSKHCDTMVKIGKRRNPPPEEESGSGADSGHSQKHKRVALHEAGGAALESPRAGAALLAKKHRSSSPRLATSTGPAEQPAAQTAAARRAGAAICAPQARRRPSLGRGPLRVPARMAPRPGCGDPRGASLPLVSLRKHITHKEWHSGLAGWRRDVEQCSCETAALALRRRDGSSLGRG